MSTGTPDAQAQPPAGNAREEAPAPQPPTPQEQPDGTMPKTPDVTPQRRKRLGVLPAIAASVIVLAAAGGVGYAFWDHGHTTTAPRAAASPTATPSPVFGSRANGSHYGSLRDLLLPPPSGYALGPDEGGLGNDAALTGTALTQQVAQQFSQLDDAGRKQIQQALAAAGLRAVGVRTYRDTAPGDLEIDINLMQLNPAAAKSVADVDNRLFQALTTLRTGPSVPGHPEAHCYLSPKASSSDALDAMVCVAGAGDLVASLEAEGPQPLDGNAVAQLFTAQLDRIRIPGTPA